MRVSESEKATDWLAQSIELFTSMKESSEEDASMYYKMHKLSFHDLNKTALSNLFEPLTDEIKSMNCSYFHHLHGIELLVKFGWFRCSRATELKKTCMSLLAIRK